MATYTMTCDMDHGPMTMSVTAESDDMAMEEMMSKVRPHLAEMHQDMNMDDSGLMEMIKGKWHKEG